MPPIFAFLPLLRGGRLGREVILGHPHELPIKILVIVNLNAIPLRRRPFVVNSFKTTAQTERRISNRSHAIGNYNTRKVALIERTSPNFGHAVGKYNVFEIITATETPILVTPSGIVTVPVILSGTNMISVFCLLYTIPSWLL